MKVVTLCLSSSGLPWLCYYTVCPLLSVRCVFSSLVAGMEINQHSQIAPEVHTTFSGFPWSRLGLPPGASLSLLCCLAGAYCLSPQVHQVVLYTLPLRSFPRTLLLKGVSPSWIHELSMVSPLHCWAGQCGFHSLLLTSLLQLAHTQNFFYF